MGKVITFYKTATGKCPIEDFLDSLPDKDARKVTWVLSLIEDLEKVPASYFKKLVGTDIWECRAGRYRILCFVAGNSMVVLTHGFVKKSQKTPTSEIERAAAYRKDFLNRRRRNASINNETV